MPKYPNATQCLSIHHVEIQTVTPGAKLDATTSLRPCVPILVEQTHVYDVNLQKQLLLEYKWYSKNKSVEYTKFLTEKKALITIIFGQCDEATKTKIALGATYAVDCKERNLINIINQLQTVCFSDDDDGLSYGPYKQVVVIKSMNNYTNK